MAQDLIVIGDLEAVFLQIDLQAPLQAVGLAAADGGGHGAVDLLHLKHIANAVLLRVEQVADTHIGALQEDLHLQAGNRDDPSGAVTGLPCPLDIVRLLCLRLPVLHKRRGQGRSCRLLDDRLRGHGCGLLSGQKLRGRGAAGALAGSGLVEALYDPLYRTIKK